MINIKLNSYEQSAITLGLNALILEELDKIERLKADANFADNEDFLIDSVRQGINDLQRLKLKINGDEKDVQ